MIITGKRQSGKTTYAIKTVVEKVKDGDVVGVISYSDDSSSFLLKLLNLNLERHNKKVETKIINLTDIKDVDIVLIDNLELILGDKCVCATSSVVNIESDSFIENDKVYKSVFVEKQKQKQKCNL